MSTPQSPVYVGNRRQPSGQSLADVLERVLDKGIVVVGDIQVRLLDIELLTIKIRLMVASVDRAREMGINWWEGDPFVSSLEEQDEGAAKVREEVAARDGGAVRGEVTDGSEREQELARRVEELEQRLREQEERRDSR